MHTVHPAADERPGAGVLVENLHRPLRGIPTVCVDQVVNDLAFQDKLTIRNAARLICERRLAALSLDDGEFVEAEIVLKNLAERVSASADGIHRLLQLDALVPFFQVFRIRRVKFALVVAHPLGKPRRTTLVGRRQVGGNNPLLPRREAANVAVIDNPLQDVASRVVRFTGNVRVPDAIERALHDVLQLRQVGVKRDGPLAHRHLFLVGLGVVVLARLQPDVLLQQPLVREIAHGDITRLQRIKIPLEAVRRRLRVPLDARILSSHARRLRKAFRQFVRPVVRQFLPRHEERAVVVVAHFAVGNHRHQGGENPLGVAFVNLDVALPPCAERRVVTCRDVPDLRLSALDGLLDLPTVERERRVELLPDVAVRHQVDVLREVLRVDHRHTLGVGLLLRRQLLQCRPAVGAGIVSRELCLRLLRGRGTPAFRKRVQRIDRILHRAELLRVQVGQNGASEVADPNLVFHISLLCHRFSVAVPRHPTPRPPHLAWRSGQAPRRRRIL